MLEKNIEAYLMQKVRELGGTAYKFTSPQRRSVPDRLCLFPGGIVIFVEVKSTTGKTTKSQDRELARLREMGMWVEVLSSKEMVHDFIIAVAKEIEERRPWSRTHEA